MTDKELLQTALDALDDIAWNDTAHLQREAIAALCARLADGERQEPVAVVEWRSGNFHRVKSALILDPSVEVGTHLFTAPPTAATIRAEAMEECKEAARSVIESTDIPVDRVGPAILAAIRKLAQEG